MTPPLAVLSPQPPMPTATPMPLDDRLISDNGSASRAQNVPQQSIENKWNSKARHICDIGARIYLHGLEVCCLFNG
jgi:hypothetical protein